MDANGILTHKFSVVSLKMLFFFEMLIVFLTLATISFKKSRLMHNYIIHTTLSALCHSNMFRPSKGDFQTVGLIHFHNQINKMCNKCKIQFIGEGIFQVIEQRVSLHIIHAGQ